MGKSENTPLRITYNEHLRMKEEAYKKKEQEELLSKFNKNFSMKSSDEWGEFARIKQRNEDIDEADSFNEANALKMKKDVNILNIKTYQELIRLEHPNQNSKNILKKKFS